MKRAGIDWLVGWGGNEWGFFACCAWLIERKGQRKGQGGLIVIECKSKSKYE